MTPDMRAYVTYCLEPGVWYRKNADRWKNMRNMSAVDNAVQRILNRVRGLAVEEGTMNSVRCEVDREFNPTGRSELIKNGMLELKVADEDGTAVVRFRLTPAGELCLKPLAGCAISFVARARKELPEHLHDSMYRLLGHADSALKTYKIVKAIFEYGPMNESELMKHINSNGRMSLSMPLHKLRDAGLIDFVSISTQHEDESKRALNTYRVKSIAFLGVPVEELYQLAKESAKAAGTGFPPRSIFIPVIRYIEDHLNDVLYTNDISRQIRPIFNKRGKEANPFWVSAGIRVVLRSLRDIGALEPTRPVDGSTCSKASANEMTGLFYNHIIRNVERAVNLTLDFIDTPVVTQEDERVFLENALEERGHVDDEVIGRIKRIIRRNTDFAPEKSILKRDLIAALRSYGVTGITMQSLSSIMNDLKASGQIKYIGRGCWASTGKPANQEIEYIPDSTTSP